MLKIYYRITKPGIIYGNALPAMAGFLLASKGSFHVGLFLGMLFGLSFVIASGCVFNNIYDEDIDARMERTKNRAMVTKTIPKSSAYIFGALLGIFGILILFFFSSPLSLAVALVGFVVYVCIYTPLKRRSVYAALVGAIAGAVPPVVGYVSITNHLDLAAWVLFFILVFWQMPHFYAIAIRRFDEYASAIVPVMPIKQGIRTTKIHMVVYTLGFVFFSILLTVHKYTGYTYAIVMMLTGLTWLFFVIQGFWAKDNTKWAKKTFLFSLIVLTVFSVIVSFGNTLP